MWSRAWLLSSNRVLGLAAGVLGTAAAACGSGAAESKHETPAADSGARVERCVQRLLDRAEPRPQQGNAAAQAERYVRRAYCTPFDREGWVHEDGSLAIDAYVAHEEGGTCATATPGQTATTVPCELDPNGNVLDCALLHVVRRSEVQSYLEQLPRPDDVRCDDGTPLHELGAD